LPPLAFQASGDRAILAHLHEHGQHELLPRAVGERLPEHLRDGERDPDRARRYSRRPTNHPRRLRVRGATLCSCHQARVRSALHFRGRPSWRISDVSRWAPQRKHAASRSQTFDARQQLHVTFGAIAVMARSLGPPSTTVSFHGARAQKIPFFPRPHRSARPSRLTSPSCTVDPYWSAPQLRLSVK
jgi:hypothetical protein